MRPSHEDEERFRRVYRAHFSPLLAYALRRVAQREDAADVVAETFMVAWRRCAEIPPGDEARLWLYGVARRVLANHHRGSIRRERLGERLRERLTTTISDPADGVDERLTVRSALGRLGDLDREVLTLTVWEGLQPRDVAAVLDISAAAVRTRLNRARARLRRLLGDDTSVPGHVRGVATIRAAKEDR